MEENPPHGFWLSPLQRRLITTALAGLSVFVIGALLYGLFSLLSAFVQGFSEVLWPLAVAGIVTMLLQPIVGFVESKTRMGRTAAIAVLYAIVVIALGAVLAFLVPIIVSQTVQFVKALPSIVGGLREALLESFPQMIEFLNSVIGPERLKEVGETLQSRLASLPEKAIPVASTLGSYLSSVFGVAAGLAIIPVYVFFFLNVRGDKTKDVEEQLSWVKKEIRGDLIFLGTHFARSMEAFFRGQILIGLIMGVLLGTGFSLAGVNFGFPLGLFIGLLNIIPYFGTMIGLATVLPIAWFQPEGGPVLAGIALGVFVGVQMLEGYVLTPRIMGDKTGLHPLAIIIAIFFWGTALGGILGMILAIPLTAFLVVAWRLFREKYLTRWLENGGGATEEPGQAE